MASACACSALFLVTVLSLLTFSTASFFHVGGSDGWSSSKNVNYTKWSSSIHFQVNDVLVFEYDNKTENVLRVNPRNFNSCNLSNPARKWTSGSDQVRLRHPGVYYFVSSLDGKCESRAKVSVEVFDNGSDHDAPSPAPPSPVVDPTPAPAPAPNHSSAVSAKASGLAMGLLLVSLMLIIFV